MQRGGKCERRNRKDNESRDFLCKCGKNYLSYAAAYTHVKNKHHLESDFVDNIQKPVRDKLKRGRPKQKKQTIRSLQTTLLTLIESSILKICSEIESTFDRVILEGNEERDQNQCNFCYEYLCKLKEQELSEIQLESDDNEEFVSKLNKDFSCQIACRIKLISTAIANMQEEEGSFLKKLGELNIWKGKNKVNDIILDAYKEWQQYQIAGMPPPAMDGSEQIE